MRFVNANKSEVNPLPIIDISKCTKCDKCLNICPHDVIIKASNTACAKCIKYCISIKVPCNPNNYVFCYDKCDSCGLCVSACKSEAIYWYKVVQL